MTLDEVINHCKKLVAAQYKRDFEFRMEIAKHATEVIEDSQHRYKKISIKQFAESISIDNREMKYVVTYDQLVKWINVYKMYRVIPGHKRKNIDVTALGAAAKRSKKNDSDVKKQQIYDNMKKNKIIEKRLRAPGERYTDYKEVIAAMALLEYSLPKIRPTPLQTQKIAEAAKGLKAELGAMQRRFDPKLVMGANQ